MDLVQVLIEFSSSWLSPLQTLSELLGIQYLLWEHFHLFSSSSSQSATLSATTSATQMLAKFARGGDQPPEKNVPIAPTCQGGSLPIIGSQAKTEEKGTEEPKDGATAPISPSHATIPPPSPHATPISSTHHSPTASTSDPFLKPVGSPIQIVDIGDDKSSNSESTESDEVAKETQEEEKAPSSSRLLSRDPKNPFSATTTAVTLVKKKFFSIESLGTTSKVISAES